MSPSDGLSRRRMLQASGALVAGGLVGWPVATAAPATSNTLTIMAGTNVSAAVSPDGSTVVFDVLGVLWTMPVDGGPARPLTPENLEVTQPRWAPGGNSVVCQAYAGGNFHLSLISTRDGQPRQLTTGPFDHREPSFSPDGRRIVFSSDRSGRYGIHVLDLETGQITDWAAGPADESAPAWSPDGSRLAVVVGGSAIDSVDAAGHRERLADGKEASVVAPSWRPDGATVAYIKYYDLMGRFSSRAAQIVIGDTVVTEAGEDVFPFPVTWLSQTEILYTADGVVRVRDLQSGTRRDIKFMVDAPVRRPRTPRPAALPSPGEHPVRGIVSPALAPAGDRIAFCALGDLWISDLTGRADRLTRDTHLVCDPAWSPDGRSLAYATDRSGTTDLWVRDRQDGSERQVTALPSAAVAPAWSPDSSRIAFHDQDGATHVLTVASGEVRKVLDPVKDPGRASWSPDGSILAFAAQKPRSQRFREGENQILTLNLNTGAVAYHAVLPDRSISGRGYDGPVWSPDGTEMAFILGGTLWVLPVDSQGQPSGTPRQITTEAADAPSWSGDSRTLLYLSLGRLRLIDRKGGAARTVALSLSWSPARVSGRTVIRAGALWDGESDSLRRDVDIVVDGDRIAGIEPIRADRTGNSIVDARHLTVMPGLVDMHTHVHLKGRFLGSRQGRLWLSFGVTSVRSPGDPAYLAAQTREAVASGGQLGPRYFAAGEPIDGSRVYYNFTRPTTSQQEVAREIDRARALEYDLLKTYVRLPAQSQEYALGEAEKLGIPVTSHYAYPAARFGLQGMEHLGATNRLGYSQTLSRLGHSYDDVVTLIGKTGMSIAPTLFVSTVLLADDNSWLDDERIRKLYPAWDYEALRNTVAQVTKTPEITEGLRTMLAANVSTVRRISQAGGLVIAGTDAPIDHLALSLHLNLRALVKHGMTAFRALQTATRNAAIALGAQENLGTVKPGKLADLVLVEGDPLRDITCAAAVRKTMAAGVLHDVEELISLPAQQESHAANRRLPALPARGTFWWHDASARAMHSCC